MRRLLGPLTLIAGLAAGCGGTGDTPTTKVTATPHEARQIVNGPVAPSPATSPLTLALTGVPDPVQIRFGRPPRSGLLFDLDTGRVLWRKDPTRVLPIASVTKMMTALVVVDRVPEGAKVRITKEALAYQGSGVGLLPKNKWVGLSAMLHGLLLPSGNDAAIALAQRTAGTVPRFVALMNARAAAMGLNCTRYASPSGFVDRGNHSCATDLAVQARAVLDEPRLARIVKRRSATLRFPIKGGKLYLYNHNPLLRRGYPGTIGIKTGFTDAAGRCLVAAVQRDGHRLGVVLLHSPDPGGQAVKLFDRGFRALGA
ncbi:MAG TPA: D-alanyl-D-alanine carboxypeptidase family protein [Baekduia sp.]|nr:D-alanyl-D-alanine carboxypeptidase family protein [Baekduia sp.]